MVKISKSKPKVLSLNKKVVLLISLFTKIRINVPLLQTRGVMKNYLFIVLIILLGGHLTSAQDFYTEKWQEAEKLELENKIKDAKEIVEKIYRHAKRKKDHDQLVKTFIFRAKFDLIKEENAQQKVLNELEALISKAKFPNKNIYHSVYAKLLNDYVDQNRWQIQNRTSGGVMDQKDFLTWDAKTFYAKISEQYQLSLKDRNKLGKLLVSDFSAILYDRPLGRELRPTLLDLLAREALGFFKTGYNSLTAPKESYTITSKNAFLPTQELKKLKRPAGDTVYSKYDVLQLYASLEEWHLSQKNEAPYVTVVLERLEYERGILGSSGHLPNYTAFQERLLEQYKDQALSTLVSHQLAQYYYDRSNSLEVKTRQAARDQAIEMAKEAIDKFPDSYGSSKCAALLSAIYKPSLSVQLQDLIIPNKPHRGVVSYQNVDNAAMSFIKVPFDHNRNKGYRDSLYRAALKNAQKENRIAFYKEFKLRSSKDTYSHTYEYDAKGLAAGTYLVILETNQEDSKSISGSYMTVSQMSLFKRAVEIQILDRKSGKPLENVEIELSINNAWFKTAGRTNKEGKFILPYHDERNIRLKANLTDDVLIENIYHYDTRIDDIKEELNVKTFLYLDRAIYRPGQTVYYKGIAVSKKGDLSNVVVGEEFEVIVEDANGEEVFSTKSTTNEYGSFHGEFTLPKEVLTGAFTMEIDTAKDSDFWDVVGDFESGEFSFKVEEYKRPSFKADFKEVEATYKINDIVAVTVHAKALLGSNITGAEVHYKVTRSARLPWWKYSGYNFRAQIILDSNELEGDFKTDNQGEFEIKFKAVADSILAGKDVHPIYSYQIEVEITDLNGETRTASTSVRVGQQALELSVISPAILSVENNKVKVVAKNLNGKAINATIELQIRQLQQPDHVVISSGLPQAEFQELNDVNYRQRYPYTDLRPSEQAGEWKDAPIIFKKRTTTDSLTAIEIPITKNWDNGNYVIYIKAIEIGKEKSLDKEEDYVEERVKKEVWANKNRSVNPVIVSHHHKIEGDFAVVDFFTAMDGVYMQLLTYDEKEIMEEKTLFLSKGKTTKKFNLKEANGQKIEFRYAVQIENEYVSHQFSAGIEKAAASNYQITTNTFRDKLYPGMEEEWSFTIKDQDNTAMNAEVLASMYDKSLDEFTTASWNGFSFYRNQRNFEPDFFNELTRLKTFNNTNYLRPAATFNPEMGYPRLTYFGLSFNANQYQYTRYKRELAKRYAPVDKIKGYIVGRVLGPDGDEVIGVTISVKGTSVFATTNFDGLYQIKAHPEEVLVFSYAGYETQELVVGSQQVIHVSLNSNSLDTVIVMGYSNKARLMSSVSFSAISDDSESWSPKDSIGGILQGRVSGLEVSYADGEPGASAEVIIRGASSLNGNPQPLYIIDGIPVHEATFNALDPSAIKEIATLTGANATSIYGNRAANGVIIISTKEGVSANDLVLQEMAWNNVQIRKDLKETAFFLPELQTDQEGNLKFFFTSPEMLTQWKLRLFAHNKQAETAYLEKRVVTQKELSLVPNAPRFLRETDTIRFSTKIANLSDSNMEGIATLKLFDALTMQPIDQELQNTKALQNFTAAKGGNASVNWTFVIPVGTQAVTYRVIAKAGAFSDGEENTLPVLTNRMLVTESRSLWVRAGETETLVMDKLENNTSTTLENHQMTFEYTSNPSWYAIKSLPYLMEYEHNCAEQVFSRYYANAVVAHILKSSPEVKEVFDSWAANGTNKSKLEQNEELKSIILAHTPWLRDAQTEAQKQQRLATLFDLEKTAREKKKTLAKLEEKQMASGGFPWFSGGRMNEYITRHIAAGIGHLNKLGVNDKDRPQTDRIYTNAIAAVDRAWAKRFNDCLKNQKSLKKFNFGASYWHYQYARSFEKSVVDQKMQKVLENGRKVAFAKAEKEFASQPLYTQLLMALSLHRNGESKSASNILEGLRQIAVRNKENGMYWKENNNSWYWYSSDIETQALAIEAFSEIEKDAKTVEELQVWLLKNKRTTQWKSTKATADATYALLLQNGNWTDVAVKNKITWAGKALPKEKMAAVTKEAGTGYFKISLDKNEITKEHARVEVKNKGEVTGYGGLYWQYFEDLDKITVDDNGPLSVKKKLFKKVSNNSGEELKEITKEDALEIGDLITIRIEIRSTADMDFVHLKDMRASGFEPVEVLSEYKWQDGLGYYQSTKDIATHFFFDKITKGTYVFEYEVRANNAGHFSNGITSLESMYAPEFSSHSAGERVRIEK
ncbi:MAG: TonB-dependent SusC/RagA subfamily outer membrane receptor [Nonlabens sp.]